MQTYVDKTNILFGKMQADPESVLLYRNQIVEENLRLVGHILKKYRPYTDDQYQAGCMGLIVSVDTYKAERGVPFANYACFCIEREIHKMHRYQNTLIENIFAQNLVYLDKQIESRDGDTISQVDLIADVLAEEDFEQMLTHYDLSNFFADVITPAIDSVAGATKGQNVKIDLVDWKEMELRYLLELAQNDSQKIRFNLTQMAKHLNMSVQNVRTRHIRVVETIKKICQERGLHA